MAADEPERLPGRTDHMAQSEVDEVMESLPASRKPGAFQALAFRNYRLFFYGQLISVAGTWMQSVAQQWLVWELTKSAQWLGIVSGANAIPFVLFTLWGGQIADRYSRRAILIWTQTLAMILAFVLALLATKSLSPIPLQAWHIVVITALGGIVNAFNMPAQQAFVTDMIEDRKVLSNAIALNSLRFNIARVLGPVLAGVVLASLGAAACFFLNGVSFIAVIISLFMMRLPPVEPVTQRAPASEGFLYIWRNRSVLRIMLLLAASSLFAWPVSTLFPVFASQFHVYEKGYGVMMAANGLGAAVGGFWLASQGAASDRRQVIYGGAIVFSVILLLLSVAHVYWLALVWITLSGCAMILFAMSAQTKVQEEVPDALRGRVLAVYQLIFNGFFALGGLQIGVVAQHLHPQGAVAASAALCLVITLAVLAWNIADRKRLQRMIEKDAITP